MEKQLNEWCVDQIQNFGKISRKSISDKALSLTSKNDSFKASRGWLKNFLKRYELNLKD